jgi:two-component system NtrC family sensor kinase
MQEEKPSILNIAIIGGGTYCKEFLEKTTMDYRAREVNARFVAVADPDSHSPGMVVAKKLGLITLNDYHELYAPQYHIHLLIILTPEQGVLEDVLRTKPFHIRAQSYHVFEVFWKAISIEEQKLRDRNEEIETILNGIDEFISVITPEREIVDVNEGFLRQMGCSREEAIGRKCYEVFQKMKMPCSDGSFTCPLNEVIRNQRYSQQIMTRTGQNGENRYYEVSTYPIWEKSGKISKFVDISRDITKRLKEEEEITRRLEQMVEERTCQLQETHAKLLHQDKMASLGKLAASVVHEINNPISGILNLTLLTKRIIEEGPVNQKEIREFSKYLDLMEKETRRTIRIVSNLLAFARQSKMELTSVNLNRLIEQTLFLNANLLKINKVKVDKRLDPNLPDLVGSSDQLLQVFMNIISNAAEGMEATGGGVLSIETRHSIKARKLYVKFKDTGSGVPHENLPKLFDPFFTTKREGKGVGLGLSVAYGIVQEHGGSIDVQSEMGKGTTFEVELPLKHTPIEH